MKSAILAIAATVAFAAATGLAANPLLNPGFEDGDKQWAIRDAMSTIVADAAHEGHMGLRVADDDPANGSSIQSSSLPVKPGQDLELHFWARTKTDFAAVYLFFFNAAGKVIKDPAQKAGAGSPVCPIKETDGNWNSYSLAAKAPEEAASVAVWIHSFSTSKGVADFDDFALSGLAEDAKPVVVARTVPAPPPLDLSKLPLRSKPPVIIIKVDDLRQTDGKVHALWHRVADLFEARKIKGSIGIICETLGDATPAYTHWIKDQQASGGIEFWFHGYDHRVHEENGKQFNEFNGRTYEDQKQRFDRSQQLAIEKLGFPFRTFGPGGGVGSGSQDSNTIRAMADDPYMKVWLYPTPIDDAGRKLEAAGKVTILDRVWDVNIERAVGVPDFNRFVAGYMKHPDREYFVIQGHPMQWGNPGRFDEFTKIIDFLIEQHAVFLTPSEYVAERLSQSSKADSGK